MDPLLSEEPPRQAQEDALGGDMAQPLSLPHHIRQCLINRILIISLLLISIGEHPKVYCLCPPRNSASWIQSDPKRPRIPGALVGTYRHR